MPLGWRLGNSSRGSKEGVSFQPVTSIAFSLYKQEQEVDLNDIYRPPERVLGSTLNSNKETNSLEKGFVFSSLDAVLFQFSSPC